MDSTNPDPQNVPDDDRREDIEDLNLDDGDTTK